MIIPSWHYLLNKPEQTATIRTQPSDFFVSETSAINSMIKVSI